MMSNFIQKLTSRKFWLAVAGVVTGIAMTLGTETSDIGIIAGAVTTLISAVTYIIIEGRVDAESVKNTILKVQEAINTLQDGEE